MFNENIRIGAFNEEFLSGYVNNEFINYITNTPEQIGAFIMAYGLKGDIIITDMLDIMVVKTHRIFLDKCPDVDYLLNYLQPVMIKLQTGELEIDYTPYVVKETPFDID